MGIWEALYIADSIPFSWAPRGGFRSPAQKAIVLPEAAIGVHCCPNIGLARRVHSGQAIDNPGSFHSRLE